MAIAGKLRQLRQINPFKNLSDNYKEALELLQERYGNKNLIISCHMNQLLKIPPVTSDKDVKGLRIFYDTLESHIRSLLSSKVDSSSYGALLTPIVMERLPHSIKLILSRDLKDKGWDLTRLQNTFQNEL